jgi:Tat protein secretion system quality control protein TatD with DNase activity
MTLTEKRDQLIADLRYFEDPQDRLGFVLDAVPAAIGEIGLDRWIENPDLPLQEKTFREQLRLAALRELPVSIHCLKAWGASMRYSAKSPGPAAVSCFTPTAVRRRWSRDLPNWAPISACPATLPTNARRGSARLFRWCQGTGCSLRLTLPTCGRRKLGTIIP